MLGGLKMNIKINNATQLSEVFEMYGRSEAISHYAGYAALYDFLEELHSGDEEDYSIDVIGLCCDMWDVEEEDLMLEWDCDTLEELEERLNIEDNMILMYEAHDVKHYIVFLG
jgi:hypothetical protein